jgi:predicted secreted protein
MEPKMSPEEIKKEFDDKLLKLKESLNKIHDIVDTIKSKTDEWVN